MSYLEIQLLSGVSGGYITGLSDKWFYKLIQDDLFPKPIKLGRSSRWLKSDVEEWLYNRIYESRP
ncbi:helix-turn-helix transcriptional regulator [Citrobacter amalonaticus]|uniref:helix-turn-helix transcriptional regulator n=1 Tax=Citrobacter amalonaticus TaxID=35703 RepID=UPI0037C10005